MSTEVEKYEEVPEGKAGLKRVYILTTEDGKFVFSDGRNGGENWFSGCFVEPLINQWLESNWSEDRIPSVTNYSISQKYMITEYMGRKDAKRTPEIAKSFGIVLGEIHSIDSFKGFGGMIVRDDKLLSERLGWREFLISRLKNMCGDYVEISKIDRGRVNGVTPCFSHGDARFQNIRIDDKSNISCLLDWQNAWVSDGLTEFLHSRLRSFGIEYDTKTASEFTAGYRQNMPKEILEYTDYQSTLSLLYALSRLRDYKVRTGKNMGRISSSQHIDRVLEKYKATKNTISVSCLLDEDTNLRHY